MNPYGDLIREHSLHPRNCGPLTSPDIRAEDVNPFCGDRVRIEISLIDRKTVGEAGFQGDLCVIARAAASLLTEMVRGLTLDQLAEVSDEAMLTALRAEIAPSRRNCALLPLKVLRSGVADLPRTPPE